MKIALIYNLQSLFVKKETLPIAINSNFQSTDRIISVKNLIYDNKIIKFQLVPSSVKEVKLITNNLNSCRNFSIPFKHSILPFYSKKYSIENTYLLDNIEEFYRITKVFVIMFNDKYKGINSLELIIKPDVIFSILKFNEKNISNINEYKKLKVDKVIPKELFDSIKRL